MSRTLTFTGGGLVVEGVVGRDIGGKMWDEDTQGERNLGCTLTLECHKQKDTDD